MIEGFEITTRDDGENSVVSLARHNAALAMVGYAAVGPDDWFGVILADHGLVASFCTADLANHFLATALAA